MVTWPAVKGSPDARRCPSSGHYQHPLSSSHAACRLAAKGQQEAAWKHRSGRPRGSNRGTGVEAENDTMPKWNVHESAWIFETRWGVRGKVSTFKSISSHALEDQKRDIGEWQLALGKAESVFAWMSHFVHSQEGFLGWLRHNFKKKPEQSVKKRLGTFMSVSGQGKLIMMNSSHAMVCQEEIGKLGKISHDLGASQVGWWLR